MKRLDLQGERHGRRVLTTLADDATPCPRNRVNRVLKAERPNERGELWVSNFICVSTWQGWLYVAFIIDAYARRIVGVSVAPLRSTSF
jgi:transposase InsO family protein